MLDIYYGSGAVDKEQFLFQQIDPREKTILLVPDQFSLQAERDAFRYLKQKALTELMIADFSTLGRKVVQEVEGKEPEIIDRYGRQMLLSILISQEADKLKTYGRQGGIRFAEQMNTMISELKRYEISPEQLEEIRADLEEEEKEGGKANPYLQLKLADILHLYRLYEERVRGVYQDAEDYISYYAGLIPRSSLVRDARIWIYGFDTFTPKNLQVIGKLLEAGKNVSVILTSEQKKDEGLPLVRALTLNGGEGLFDLSRRVGEKLREVGERSGVRCNFSVIDGAPKRSIWTDPKKDPADSIVLCQTTDPYREAERAAAFIQGLVRDEGYRYEEIAVVCNDREGVGAALQRLLQRMDIPVFADRKRKVLHQPMVSFLLSFLDVLIYGYQNDGLMGMIKSGLLGWTMEEESLFENYVRQFRIAGSRWKKDFHYGKGDYSQEEMDLLNDLRKSLVDTCEQARDSMGRRNTAEEKVLGLYLFLQEDFHVEDRIGELIQRQSEQGLEEGAQETAQIWNAIGSVLDQIQRIVGQEKISNETLAEMIRSGLRSLEIGLVPAGADCILMGTLQRTRPGHIRALLVVGMADGVLPLQAEEDGLLTRQELQILENRDIELARKDRISAQEEQLAIYRMFALPTEHLYASCSQSKTDGSPQRPSGVFEALRKIQPAAAGNLEDGGFLDQILNQRGTIPFLAQAIREEKQGKAVHRGWSHVAEWYEQRDPRMIQRLREAGDFSNRREALGQEMADALYRGDRSEITASATQLEQYSGCAFAHFIRYGLKAREQRIFEVGGREIGDIYHQCIMEYCRALSEVKGSSGQPGWAAISRQECDEKIREILEDSREAYREGLFESDGYSQFRMERIREICSDVAWALTWQVRQGQIREMRFEETFGRPGKLPPITIDTNMGRVRVRGTIDRMDVLGDPGEDESLRIIDYKTGSNSVDLDEIRGGYQIQLALYMDAASKAAENAEPAGILYFNIGDFLVDGDKQKIPDASDPEDLEMRMRMNYRLDGVLINDPRILGNMDEKMKTGSKGESTVIRVKYDPAKDLYTSRKGTILLEKEEFQELLRESRQQVERICREICEGRLEAAPHKSGERDRNSEEITACRYCGYRSICMFDRSFTGCRYQ